MLLRHPCLLFFVAAVTAAQCQVPGRELTAGNASVQIRMETEGNSGEDPSGRLLSDAQQWSQTLGAIKPGSQPQIKRGAAGTVGALTVQFASEPQFIHAFVTMDSGSAICHVRAQSGFKTMFTISNAFQRCSTELKTANANVAAAGPPAPSAAPPASAAMGPTVTTRPSTRPAVRPGSPPPAVSADQPPAHPENWQNVADVLFRTAYTGGVGGMLVVNYEPLVLFRDGTYFEIANQALEDVDVAAERQARPVHWGTWRMQGITYILTDNKGRPHDYKLQDGNLFKAYDATAGGPLNMRYKCVTGGGNSALGGDISIMVESRMAFAADGRFSNGHDVGMVGSGNTSGVSMAGGSSRRRGIGTYKIQKHTIELHYADGHSERKFFAYASSHQPATLDRELIFIGDTSYVHDK